MPAVSWRPLRNEHDPSVGSPQNSGATGDVAALAGEVMVGPQLIGAAVLEDVVLSLDSTPLGSRPAPYAENKSLANSSQWQDDRTARQRCIDGFILNFCGVMWHADNALLPAVYLELSQEFGVGPAELGVMSMLRGITESVCALPAGFAAEIKPRPSLVCAAVLVWALGIIVCGFVPSGRHNWLWLVLGRMLNGAGLGTAQPLLYSLISDTNPPERRGRAFGMLQLTGNIGSLVGCFTSTLIAPRFGHMGWRLIFIMFGVVSGGIGLAVGALVREPRGEHYSGKDRTTSSFWSVVRAKSPEMSNILKVPTFIVILAQGVAGTAPWYAFAYLTLWLELGCFSHMQAAIVYACFGGGQALAGLVGGRLLDFVASRFPDHGPPWLCMSSVCAGLPLFAFVFFGLQDGGTDNAGDVSDFTVVFFSLTFVIVGLLISWCGIANNKIFADIVPAHIYTYVYALDRCIEGAVGAFGTPAVGILTDHVFQYDPHAVDGGNCSRPDAHSLGKGIFSVASSMWALCLVFYGLLHVTYPRDRHCGYTEANAQYLH